MAFLRFHTNSYISAIVHHTHPFRLRLGDLWWHLYINRSLFESVSRPFDCSTRVYFCVIGLHDLRCYMHVAS